MAEEKMDIDEGLYSRQLYVLGHDAMRKMGMSHVLLVGLNGVGAEVAKNILLAGVKSVTLLDDTPVAAADLGAHFYLTQDDIGKPRAAACADRLRELNRYVALDVVTGDVSAAVSSGRFQVVVVVGGTVSSNIGVNELCRRHNVKFICADALGLIATCFVDLGPQFEVLDSDGENVFTGIVSSVSEEGVVTVYDERRHGMQTGDFVKFEEIEGLAALNSGEYCIKELGPFTFQLQDTDVTAMGAYSGGGRFIQVKKGKTLEFRPLAESVKEPSIVDTDFAKFSNPAQLHVLLQALSQFVEKHGNLPRPHVLDDAREVLSATKVMAGDAVDIDDRLITRLARCSCAVLSPMAAFLGGVVGQEVLKACSGKFTPLRQHLYFDAVECLPDNDLELPASEYAPEESRYDAYTAVFGRSLQSRVSGLRSFLVGAGAIGCEMLKNWAMMGVACDGNGCVNVTDMDTIEKSNLNRQFLFRSTDVGKLKSEAAAKAATAMNPSLRIKPTANRVGAETENVYNDDFWQGIDFVCTALDNVDARLYVDGRCVYYQKPMLESGTLGTKGNTQVVVPFVTESYGSSRDPPEESVPICTLKNFPNKIEHTIQWGRDQFEGWFTQQPSDVNSYLDSASYLKELEKQQNTQMETLRTIKENLVDRKPLSFDECIQWARLKFEVEYNHNIQQLLHNFPVDSLTSSGAKFWSGPKRAPSPLSFNAEDPLHMRYVLSAANLRAFMYGIKGSTDESHFSSVLSQTSVPSFKARQVKIATTDAEAKEQSSASQDHADEDEYGRSIRELTSALPDRATLAGYHLEVANFEKDDPTNYHIAFIAASGNLRARNYRIPEVTEHEAKGVAGKIIPAIATTTALVTGLVCLELYKVVQSKNIEAYKNGFVNLALPLFTFSEPIPPAKVKAALKEGEWEWSLWDRIEIDMGDITLQQFMDHMEERYGLEVSMLSYGAAMLYSFFGNRKKINERLKMPMSRVAETVSKKPLNPDEKYLLLEACVDSLQGEEVEIPCIRMKIR